VFVSGDCASLAPVSPPKAGVYAVREGPIVAENLLRLLRNDSNLVKYEPQKGSRGCGSPRCRRRLNPASLALTRASAGFLSLLNLGDGTAILSFKGFVCRCGPAPALYLSIYLSLSLSRAVNLTSPPRAAIAQRSGSRTRSTSASWTASAWRRWARRRVSDPGARAL
jgi:NADH dehydrogenase FAD-containing subunit